MITIKDVANLAGVSPGTVSNALTGKRPVSPETRERIFQAIEELGYKPNLLARSLVNQRSHTLAVVTSEVEYYVPSRILTGIDEQAEQLGYSLLLSLMRDPAQEDVGNILLNLSARQVDGIVWAVHEVGNNRSWFHPKRTHALPPIVFLAMEPRFDFSVVATDNRSGARQAVQHLLENGCRSIGLITGPLDWWEARERKIGWRETLLQAGLEAPESLTAEGNWSAASGEEGLRHLLATQPEIDGLFVSNDQMAVGALRAAHALGCRVPQDLAIVGFDDIPESVYFWPPLTTVHQQLRELGRTAVRELHCAIEMHRQRATDDDAPPNDRPSEAEGREGESKRPKETQGEHSKMDQTEAIRWGGSPLVRLLKPKLIVRESSVLPSQGQN